MSDRPNQNWEARDIDSRGSKFRIDVNNPQMGDDGYNAYIMYGAVSYTHLTLPTKRIV